jgi:regulator of cell morphogenesis and NO signaling
VSQAEVSVSQYRETDIVGDVAAADARAAAVFERFGIDFCCGGRRSIAEACRAGAANSDDVVHALDALPPTGRAESVTSWSTDRLIDHIVNTHHAYVRTALPTITRHLEQIGQAHGSRHAELASVVDSFSQLRGELEQHLLKEERILFPYIRDLAAAADLCGRTPSPFGTVENPIRMLEHEHRDAADELETIRRLTDGYTPPEDACATYTVCMAELREFEADLHRHVHLENNVLFPRAIALERGIATEP